MSVPQYDVIVVGAGMFGSSAAKHLRKLDKEGKLKVAIIGPNVNTNDLCRGQHFDEARICRRLEQVLPWAYLNNDGVRSYAETERESGISFFTPCGLVWVANEEDKEEMSACTHRVEHGVRDAALRPFHFYDNATDSEALAQDKSKEENYIAVLNSASVAEQQFDHAVSVSQFAEKDAGKKTYYMIEKGPYAAGTVHPARYVEAQLRCAAQVEPRENFCHIADQVVTSVRRAAAAAPAVYEVGTDKGNVYTAGKVLIAAASFACYHNLIPQKVQKLLLPIPEHVVLLRVNPPGVTDGTLSLNGARAEDVAASQALPAVIRTTGKLVERFYCLPPRYYADEGMQGWFIKMGGIASHDMATELKRAEDYKQQRQQVDGVECAKRSQEEQKLHEDEVTRPFYDISNLKAAMDWYNGTTPLHATSTSGLTEMLSTVYPKWSLVRDGDGGSGTPSAGQPVLRGKDGKPLKNSFVVRCIWDLTQDCSPIIDNIPDSDDSDGEGSGLYVALGGNGRGAKACDPIGHIAAFKLLCGAKAPLPAELSHHEGLYKA